MTHNCNSIEAGYSLTELLVAMTVSITLTGAMYSVLFQTQATTEAQLDQAALRQQARVAIDRIAEELRVTGFDLGSAPERLTDASATSIALVADIDNGDIAAPCGLADETAVGGGAERVSYRLQGTDLLRSVDCWDGGAWGNEYTNLIVASNVQKVRPLFRYFDADGNELLPGTGTLNPTNRDLVRVVRIDLELLGTDDQALGIEYVSFSLQTAVRLRNAEF